MSENNFFLNRINQVLKQIGIILKNRNLTAKKLEFICQIDL